MKEVIYNKLVRDKIPKIIKDNGETPLTRTLSTEEYKLALFEKVLEELEEVQKATTKKEYQEELADMLEIIKSLGEIEGITLEKIIQTMHEKATKRVGFSKKIFLEKVIT